jgi:hypothetical protein
MEKVKQYATRLWSLALAHKKVTAIIISVILILIIVQT